MYTYIIYIKLYKFHLIKYKKVLKLISYYSEIYVRPILVTLFKKKTLIKLSLCKEVLPVIYLIVVTYPIHHIMIDWLNLD